MAERDARAAGATDPGTSSQPMEPGSRPVPGWTVAVVGAGSWGTALAIHAARGGHRVRLWARREEAAREMDRQRENRRYLEGAGFPDGLEVTADAAAAMDDADLILSVVPSRYLEDVWTQVEGAFPAGAHLVSATKGLEKGGRRMTEVLAGLVGPRAASVSALSGPSFAREVAEEQPTAVALGCPDVDRVAEVQTRLSHGPLRIYRNADVVGVEMGGALKNVIALAAGMVDGLGLGTNSRAALITRGLKEMARLAAARGAEPRTLMGLAGLGDLVLTCTGSLSRNRSVGVELGKGREPGEIIGSMHMVAEGVATVEAARELGRAEGVAMPITDQVHAILQGEQRPEDAIDELLARRLVEE